jgi:hypothetical protein
MANGASAAKILVDRYCGNAAFTHDRTSPVSADKRKPDAIEVAW